ncbi:XRE family transcriptional regulator [Clostridium septicum]|uniref:XRE family transcriptional regulator n=1 Tax=Clostridium septicum TaxID=1504 RepID=A0ABY5B2B5_CLOSE|nr:XRE family transcriptional regulator [Clostridium septicum]UEC20074.1 XRE family transcriptional regulator [Clostridium septicum]USS01870.1 XRE family transcriptional regulator [Clostridium septicum]
MDKTEKLKHIILSRYNSIREFSKIVEIPSTTLTSALDKGIGGMAVDRIIKICETLNIDIKTFEPINNEKENLYSKEEKEHLDNFRNLNDLGKEKVNTYTKDLLDNPKYKKEDNKVVELPKKIKEIWEEEGKEHLMPIASHDRDGEFTAEDYKHDDDLMKNDDFWK